MDAEIAAINEKVKEESRFVDQLTAEVGKVIVGQRYMIERLMIALLTNGHILIEGVPGLAKTLAVKTLAKAIDARFQRIQFTPDLLPADLIGTMIYNQKDGTFYPKKGPIFSNLILADEINRAPAKVQSALLEAMQEHQVTISDTTYLLEEPFLVLATQNPIEQEGTYPLPEAQIDRFMLKLSITYPNKKEERDILDRMAGGAPKELAAVIHPKQILAARETVNQIYMDEKIKNYIIDLVFATRNPEAYKIQAGKYIAYGASPRATIYLAQASRAYAFLRHRGHVTPDDVKAVGLDILRHRVIITYEAEAEEITSEDIVRKIFDEVEVP
ncbi:MAG TPA: AAA family ATPase [Candidatus Sumerlaeota bacterium]|nr:MAG: ATPase family associated with various cellular activities (AAA) [candidate division BRC1 bacterium ADurb.Bin183]HOE62849.1 AAA family ATPase [Candidatus Sumerlaeota bacterium]HRR29762.1 AAA family ATPase [Candidatus Sumerlaeia bacterium]HON50199.1 AAA family ATPase [Candidatus Sumerlaeota bacterium]HOR63415.1 AAA family ATPase [Candidatus Sumerlaeota bacterium]